MIKIAIIALLMVSLSIGVIFFSIIKQQKNSTSPSPSPLIVQPVPSSSSTGDNQTSSVTASDKTQTRLSQLESTVNGLSNQLASVSAEPTLQLHQPPLYIPLGTGNGGAVSTQDWTTTTLPQATINADDYSGYTSMQLRITLRVFQGNGQAYARLFDVTDGIGVANSDVSTISQDYTSLVSQKFQLPHGEKTYHIQLKSATGYEADFQDISLKVNF